MFPYIPKLLTQKDNNKKKINICAPQFQRNLWHPKTQIKNYNSIINTITTITTTTTKQISLLKDFHATKASVMKQ